MGAMGCREPGLLAFSYPLPSHSIDLTRSVSSSYLLPFHILSTSLPQYYRPVIEKTFALFLFGLYHDRKLK